MVKNAVLLQGPWVWSLVGELKISHASRCSQKKPKQDVSGLWCALTLASVCWALPVCFPGQPRAKAESSPYLFWLQEGALWDLPPVVVIRDEFVIHQTVNAVGFYYGRFVELILLWVSSGFGIRTVRGCYVFHWRAAGLEEGRRRGEEVANLLLWDAVNSYIGNWLDRPEASRSLWLHVCVY